MLDAPANSAKVVRLRGSKVRVGPVAYRQCVEDKVVSAFG